MTVFRTSFATVLSNVGDGTVSIVQGDTANGAAHPPFFTGEAPLSNGVYYLAFPGNGSIFGWLTFSNGADSDITGMVDWFKLPQAGGKFYPGGFSFTKDNQEAKLGPIELNIKEKKNIDIPIWASIAAIVAGGVLLVAGGKRG